MGRRRTKLEVVANIAEALLDLADSLEVGSAVEGVAAEEEELEGVSGNESAISRDGLP